MKRRVALFGLFGSGNLGNDASLTAMVRFLKSTYPVAEITVVCQEPERVAAVTGLPAIRITARRNTPAGAGRRWLRPASAIGSRLLDLPYAIRKVRGFDAVVVPGMGVLEERLGGWPWAFPWMLGVWSIAAAFRWVPFGLVSVGADEAQNRFTRWLFRSTVKRSKYCSFRDQFSRGALAGMGAAVDSAPIFPDLAFALPGADPDEDPPSEGRTSVAVGVLDWYGADDDRVGGIDVFRKYVSDMVELVFALAQHGLCVKLVVGDALDATPATAIRTQFALAYPKLAARVIQEPAATTFEQLCRQLAGCSAVIASRYHNLVAALLLHKPVVSLGYGPKNDALLEAFGLGAYGQQLDDLDIACAAHQVCEVLLRRREISAALATQLDTVSAELDRQFAEVAAFISAA